MSKRAVEAALKAYPDGESPDWAPTPKIIFKQIASRAIFIRGYKQAEKDLINRIRKQVETWMPERDGDEHTEGERLSFRSVLHLLEELEDEK